MEGKVLAGRYRLLSQLGQGGMGSVWTAEHLSLQSKVAIKLLDPAIAQTSEGVERFQREARAAASLRSAHVVQVLDYGVEDGTPYLVMEQLHGESLADRIARQGVLPSALTMQVINGVAKAMARAHAAGIVHRDLKPDNVFLVEEDGELIPKVLDFGIAKHTQVGATDGVVTRTGLTMGTPFYMSPEQAEGKRSLDHRTDLWALGVITCECLTGKSPFAGETLGEILLKICARPIPVPSSLGAVPPAFDEWFARATQRDPALRFGSAKELATSLSAVLSAAPNVSAPFAATAAAPSASHHHSEAWPTTGEANHSPSATSGAVAVNVSTARSNIAWLPIGGGALAAIGLAAALAWFVWPGLGSSSEESEANPSSTPDEPVVATSGAPSEVAESDQQPSVKPVDELPSGPVKTPAVEARSGETPRTDAPSSDGKPTESGEPSLATVPKSAPKSAGSAAAQVPVAPAAPEKRAGKTLSCVKNGFTGQLEVASSGASNRFACVKDPFTGKLRRK